MMTTVGNVQRNVFGWVYEHQLGRRYFEKPIEMIVCVYFVHYDLGYAFPGHAIEDVDEQNQDQSDNIDKHLDEKEDLDKLDGQWNGMMIHDDGLIEITVDQQNQMDDDDNDHLAYDENVGVWNEKRLNSNEVLLQDDG